MSALLEPRVRHSTWTSPFLLREWQTAVDRIAAGRAVVLIRKGGVAEGRTGFAAHEGRFGLLPTLFHQTRSVEPSTAPAPPTTVSVAAELVAAYSVPSDAELEPLTLFHPYLPSQLRTRQTYRPDRPLTVLVVRPLLLSEPFRLADGEIRTLCRSWAQVPGRSLAEAAEIDGDSVAELIDRARGALRTLNAEVLR